MKPIKGCYKSVRDKTLALQYVLKSANISDLVTNIEDDEIQNSYRQVLYKESIERNSINSSFLEITDKQFNFL